MSMLQKLQDEKHEMEMTPMIDVTFLLLIFFMCTLKFKLLEGKLTAYLPKDVGTQTTQAEPIEKVQINIHVVEQGIKMNADKTEVYNDPTGKSRHTFANRKVRYTIGNQRFTELDLLQKKLKEIKDARDEDKAPAVLQPFANCITGDVIPVLDAAVSAGFRDITFGGAFDDNIK